MNRVEVEPECTVSIRSRDVATIVAALLVLKALLIVWGYISFDFQQYPHESWYSIWHRWDSVGYQRIASAGYSPEGISVAQHEFLSFVPPGSPLAIALFHQFGISLTAAALLIPFIASIAASLLLFQLMLVEFGERDSAYRAVAYLNLFPSSYFFVAAYSEALCLTFLLLTFYLMRPLNRFGLGCLAAAAAIVTRWFAANLMPCILFHAWTSIRAGTQSAKSLLYLALPVAAIELFFAINLLFYGSPFAFRAHSERNPAISRLDSFPFVNLFKVIVKVITHPAETLGDTHFVLLQGWSSLLLLISTVLFVTIARRLPAMYVVFGATYLCFLASINWAHGIHRYLLILFPLYMGLARVRNRAVFGMLIVLSTALMLNLSSYFVKGGYAY